MMQKKCVFNWSGGKDSALCLYYVLQQKEYQVEKLLTTLSGATQRVTMHGVREELLVRQAQALELPLQKVYLPEQASMGAYNQLMEQSIRPLQQQGIEFAIFGDINLEDLRTYHEQQLKQVGMQTIFPLWGRSTSGLVREFIRLGFKAVVVSVNARLLDASFVGRLLDATFLDDLPEGVDPAGENGEFHTFVYDGPIFKEPVKYKLGEKVLKSYSPAADEDDNCFSKEDKPTYDTSFWFCDLLPAW
jgi:uncharacterized protein (TIGR00290 family)